jgi:hypothetical protein
MRDKLIFKIVGIFLPAILLGTMLWSCDNRKTFLEIEQSDLVITKLGDSVMFFSGNAELDKNKIKVTFSKTEGMEWKVNYLANEAELFESGTVVANNLFAPIEKNIYEFSFLPKTQTDKSFDIDFVVKDKNGFLYTKRHSVTYKKSSNIFSITTTAGIDNDSAKVNTPFTFELTNNSTVISNRKFKLTPLSGGVFNITYLADGSSSPQNLSSDGVVTIPIGKKYRVTATPQASTSLITQTLPFAHKSLPTGFIVQAYNESNSVDDQKVIPILVFDNLPPVAIAASDFSIDFQAGTTTPVIYLNPSKTIGQVELLDRDAKWGGKVTKYAFVGFGNEVEKSHQGNTYYTVQGNVTFTASNTCVLNYPSGYGFGISYAQSSKNTTFTSSNQLNLYGLTETPAYSASPRGESAFRPFIPYIIRTGSGAISDCTCNGRFNEGLKARIALMDDNNQTGNEIVVTVY